MQHDTTISENEREQLLKSLSSDFISRTNVKKPKQFELDALQTFGYLPIDTTPAPLMTSSCFTNRLHEKYRNFPINSFYCNDPYLYDYRIKQQMRNYEIARVHSTQYLTIKHLLLNTLLTVLGDRMEMAHSVEGRLPFLDHHLVDYVNHLPVYMKLKLINGNLIEKYVLREAVRPYITDEIYRRKKHPFFAPPTFLDRTSRIHQYMHDTLNSQDMKDLGGIFNIEAIRKDLNDLQIRQEQSENKLQLKQLIMAEGFYLMLCSFATLKKRFNVKFE